jgi:hypothetical protein
MQEVLKTLRIHRAKLTFAVYFSIVTYLCLYVSPNTQPETQKRLGLFFSFVLLCLCQFLFATAPQPLKPQGIFRLLSMLSIAYLAFLVYVFF